MKIKMGPDERDEFFNELAIALNKSDLKETKELYFALARFIVKSVKKKGLINLPDVGMIRIKEMKGRLGFVPTTKIRKEYPPCNTVRFLADYKFKKYVNDKA